MTIIHPPESRQILRKQLRRARRALSARQQQAAAQGLAHRLRTLLPLLRARHVAFYLPNDGEIDPRPLVHFLEKLGKRCYLPRLYPGDNNRVWFVRYRQGDALEDNRYGIPEPLLHGERLPAWAMQVVLMPLVGFDRAGNRLGMGGGFYDRTFGFKAGRKNGRPLLIGLAHSVQEVPALPTESWDMPLDVIATEKELLRVPH